MPRKYTRKTSVGSWSEETLMAAVNAVKKKELSIRKASCMYNIPFSTLQIRIKSNNFSPPSLGCRPIFSPQQENEISEHIKKLAKLFYGLTPLQLRQTAFDYATKNNIPHSFNVGQRLAGVDWFYNFIRRNPSISVRKPEAISINRITSFNKEEVTLFYNNLEILMKKHKFTAARIYNMDETGITTVTDPGNLIAPKGQKRVGSVTSWERGKNITVICTMNASGSYVPPVFIFPRKRMDNNLSRNGPPGALYQCSKNGWTNENIFLEWLNHFKNYCKPTAEEPVLLILDNHGSHITLQAYQFCRDNNIVMLSLPPHSSHRLQPLDVTFFGPLKTAYKKECDLFMKRNALVKITPFDIAELFNKAYSNIASIQKGVSGFAATGIYPTNPNVFGDEDFYAANTFTQNEVSQNNTNDLITNTSPSTSQHLPSTSYQVPQNSSLTLEEISQQSPSTSKQTQQLIPSTSNQQTTPSSNSSIVSFEEISPIPKVLLSKVTHRRAAKQHSIIITASPMKNKLIEKEKKRQLKEKPKKIKKENLSRKPKGNGKHTIFEYF